MLPHPSPPPPPLVHERCVPCSEGMATLAITLDPVRHSFVSLLAQCKIFFCSFAACSSSPVFFRHFVVAVFLTIRAGRSFNSIIDFSSRHPYFNHTGMVSEGAIALLPSNRSKLTALGRAGGLLTPMSAFGNTITERLVATGKFDIVSEELMDGGASESKKAV